MSYLKEDGQGDIIGWVVSLIVAAILLIVFFLYILPALLSAVPK
jgi:hypothetical protein